MRRLGVVQFCGRLGKSAIRRTNDQTSLPPQAVRAVDRRRGTSGLDCRPNRARTVLTLVNERYRDLWPIESIYPQMGASDDFLFADDPIPTHEHSSRFRFEAVTELL